MREATVTWEDIEVYRFGDFINTGSGRRASNVELKNKTIITVDCWIERINKHIDENNLWYLYEELKDYWTRNKNGESPEFSAYFSYAHKAFNNPIWAGFEEFKKKGLYIESIGDVYPWPTSK